jgi:hypothetical protein
MKYSPTLYTCRRSIRLKGYDYSQAGLYANRTLNDANRTVTNENRTLNKENRTLKTELHNLIADKTGGYYLTETIKKLLS